MYQMSKLWTFADADVNIAIMISVDADIKYDFCAEAYISLYDTQSQIH